ncbi:MAG: PKD domain-containing protein [Bacteroidetes bacterium]|nr:PKD domain-containing protein [Bacteroidota bacterium]
MVNSKRWAISALLCCVCILSGQSVFAQNPPVAGITFDSLRAGFQVQEWMAYLHNTSTGSPTSWNYRVTAANCPSLPCVTYGSQNATNYSPTAIVTSNNIPGNTVKIWQIVSNAFGSDTTFIVQDFDCQHLTTPLNLEVLYYTGSLPYLSANAYANIWVNTVEINIFGPGLTTSPKYSFGSVVTDTVLVPGPVWACGYYFGSNCFSYATTCDTINIACWRSPVVILQHQMSGFQTTFTDSVIATAGAIWLWDFGDGNTSTAVSNSLTHTYAGPGTYNACLTVTDTCGTTTTCTTVNLNTTAIQALQWTDLEIVPNPSNGQFRLEGHGLLDGELRYYIQDLHSKVLAAGSLPVNRGMLRQELDLRLPQGLYWIRLEDGNGSSLVKKLVIAE